MVAAVRGTLRFRGSLLRTPSSSVQTPVRTSGRSDPPDIRMLRSSGHPDAPASSLHPDICPLAFHFPDVPPAFRTFHPHLGFRTRFPDSSNEPQTSRSSSQHSPSSLLFPLLHSPDLATVTTSDPFLSSAPDVRPGPPEPPYTQPPGYGLLPTSALAPLSLLHPVVRIPSSDFRASDSVPRVPDIGLAPPDSRNFRTTSGCPSPRSSGRPTSLGHSPGSSAPHPLRLRSGPVPCPYSRTQARFSVLRDLRNLRTIIPSAPLELTSRSHVTSVTRHVHIKDVTPGQVILSLFSKDLPSAQIVILRIFLLPRPLFTELPPVVALTAAKLTASQHHMKNVKSGTSLLSCVHLTRSSRKSGGCAVTAVQKTFSLIPAEVRRIKEADAAKEPECHADARTTQGCQAKTIISMCLLGMVSTIAAIFDGDQEEIVSTENATVELGFGPRVDCCTIFYNNLAQVEQNLCMGAELHINSNLRQDTNITTNLPQFTINLR
ncbi:hypothetical protein K438DRAFT_1938207 [Mycena galopus ATCC 62051]|nr:hypothetical protein K438DRAFT_1938207 [Mycena galopus ATCC 62051]